MAPVEKNWVCGLFQIQLNRQKYWRNCKRKCLHKNIGLLSDRHLAHKRKSFLWRRIKMPTFSLCQTFVCYHRPKNLDFDKLIISVQQKLIFCQSEKVIWVNTKIIRKTQKLLSWQTVSSQQVCSWSDKKNYVCVHTQYTITNAHTCAHCVEKREDDNISNYKDIDDWYHGR